MEQGDLHKMVAHSNLTTSNVRHLLNSGVYRQKQDWQKFIKILIMALGVGFTVAGIIFFFAYNWEDLPKFVKLGLTETLLVCMTVMAVVSSIPQAIRKILLMGAAVLAGVLFAVFGQVYQTGADAFDFFMAWTIGISLWVVVSNFAPLWMLFIILIQLCLILYNNQVSEIFSSIEICAILFLFNCLVLLTAFLLPRYKALYIPPSWWTTCIAIAAASFCTLGIVIGLLEPKQTGYGILFAEMIILYGTGIAYALIAKKALHLALIGLSWLIISNVWVFDNSEGAGSFLLVSLITVVSVTLLIMLLLNLKKKWSHEN